MCKKSLCWNCLIRLELIRGDDWECPKCRDIYYLCYACNRKGEKSWDWFGNDKGMQCSSCDNHFCMFCWQTSGKLVTGDSSESDSDNEYEEGEYICEECKSS